MALHVVDWFRLQVLLRGLLNILGREKRRCSEGLVGHVRVIRPGRILSHLDKDFKSQVKVQLEHFCRTFEATLVGLRYAQQVVFSIPFAMHVLRAVHASPIAFADLSGTCVRRSSFYSLFHSREISSGIGSCLEAVWPMIRSNQTLRQSQLFSVLCRGFRPFSDITWDASDTDVSNLLDSQIVGVTSLHPCRTFLFVASLTFWVWSAEEGLRR